MSRPPPVSLHGGHTIATDGEARAADMVRAALDKGMEVFGLSDHFYRPREPRFTYDSGGYADDYGHERWPQFVKDVLELKERRGEGPRPLEVFLGAEVEYLPGYLEWTRQEIERWPLDYVVLSVHFIEVQGRTIPFDYRPRDYRRAIELCGGLEAFFRCYYRHVLEALDWGLGDVFGHLDVVKVFAPRRVSDPEVDAQVVEVLRRCAERDMVLDLNARGLVKPCGEIYPSPEILRLAHELGVKLVPGDDSHKPADVGLNLDRALALAREAGYREIHLPPKLGGRSWAI